MLSRVADSIYWMSRYIERAENVARFVDVNHHLMLDLPADVTGQWEPLVITAGGAEDFAARYREPASCPDRRKRHAPSGRRSWTSTRTPPRRTPPRRRSRNSPTRGAGPLLGAPCAAAWVSLGARGLHVDDDLGGQSQALPESSPG